MTATDRHDAFGVYVHWPFCLSKCPYCDFNSHVRHEPIDEERFARAFAREIATTAARAPNREVTSIFLGGGTPSLLEPGTSIASTIANEFGEALDPLHRSSLLALAFVLFMLTFVVLALAKYLLLKLRQREGG